MVEPGHEVVDEEASGSVGGKGPDVPVALEGVERLRQTAREAREVAAAAIRKTSQLLEQGKASEARNAAVAAGVMCDKAERLELAIVAAEDRRASLAGGQAEVIVAVLDLFVRALGLPVTPSTRLVLRQLLLQAGAGDPMVVSPIDAEQARADVRERIVAEVRKELRQEVEPRAELPPAPSELAQEPEPVGPETVVHVSSEPSVERVEVPDAEVVDAYDDEVPQHFLDGYGGERLGRPAWEREQREAAAPPSLIVTKPSVHHLDGPRMSPPGGGV